MELDILDTDKGYRRHFMDLALWERYVREACSRHFGPPPGQVRPGLAGTCPTFIVDERWVVKFFGRLFDGAHSFQVELDTSRLVAADPAIPVPAVLASGNLREAPGAWPWPYLIYEFIPSYSFGEVYDQVAYDQKLEMARSVGEITRRIHSLPLPAAGIDSGADWPSSATIFPPTWEDYRSLLQAQRLACADNQRAWGSLPERLVDQIEDYLVAVDELVDISAVPHLIHADLTRDHLLGQLADGQWITLGLIDFGDAMVGNLYYELIALHLDLFRGDKRLLRAFLDAYKPDPLLLNNFSARAMTATLLHRFDVLVLVSPTLRQRGISSLEELGLLLWDLDAPGLKT